MAFKQADRVQETTTTTGTGSLALAGAVTGCQSFASGLGASSGTCWYVIGTVGQAQWEVGVGTLSSSTTLARTTIIASSNSGSVVDLAAGIKGVFMDAPASVLDVLNLAEITVASATTCDIGAVYGGKIAISGTTTITSFGTVTNKLRFVRFSGVLTLTHNGTSLILPGAANITTAAGDTAIFLSDTSGNWRCHDYMVAALAPFDRRSPGAIGGTTPSTGAFTALTATTINGASIDNNAWTSYTPTVTASGGTFTTVSATGVYKQIGKVVFAHIQVVVTTVGSASGRMKITLPITSVNVAMAIGGGHNTANFKSVCAEISDAQTVASVQLYDGTFPATTGDGINIFVMYEAF